MESDNPTKKRMPHSPTFRARAGDITDEFAQQIGYTFAQWLAERNGTTPDRLSVAIGCDPRPSGRRIKAALSRGITAADADVFDCGLCTTPAMFSATLPTALSAQAAVMVTGSHFGAETNGFKFLLPEGHITPEETAGLIERARNAVVPDRLVKKTDLMRAYEDSLKATMRALLKDDALKPLLGLRVVVDAQHGAGGFFERVLDDLGVDTRGSYGLEPTGLFPEGGPDPDSPASLKRLSEAVLEQEADLGVLFDPDCDRVSIVDRDGRVLDRNRLIALVAAILLEEEPGATIVTDSVTSSGLNQFITEWGGIHYRYKHGHLNVIDEAIRLNAEGIDCPLAIETSGHAAFRDNSFQDDGTYLAMRLICEAFDRKREGLTLTSLIDELREPRESVELRMSLTGSDLSESSWDVIQTVLSHTLEDRSWRLAPDNREGVRILFNLEDGIDNAWFLMRMSLNDPVVVLNAESDIEGGLKAILTELDDVLKAQDAMELDIRPLEKLLETL
ncbi:MAG: phosphomannomutase/phosphoglucomutase [Clostridiales bacterium]|nr:phosphomannomutase/phosphoglucomutase [Clostridiales bacterium]